MTTIKSSTGVLLDYVDGRPLISSLIEVQNALKRFGTGLWPIDLRNTPNNIKQRLNNSVLSAEEAQQIQHYFQLQTSELVKTIMAAGRQPHVIAGSTSSMLFVAKENEDYSHYDRLHVNESNDGVAVDEIMQMISGSAYILTQHMHGETIKLQLDCPNDDQGWLLTYSGSIPHMGSVTSATVGTKILVQVLGPQQWELRYID